MVLRSDARRLVLVVDDDHATRLLLRKVLVQSGFDVDLASNGQEALRLALGREYCAILLDLVMPRPDGLEVLRRIRQSAPALVRKIIIIEVIRLTDRCAQQ